jgi:L-seryl-tRNA(Ser) seleniumtransferase
MTAKAIFDRRSFFKWASALPVLGSIAVQGLFDRANAAVRRDFQRNIYTRIGVRPLLNARGTWTYLSASLELPEVRAATEEAANYFVDMYELHRAVGRRLAELSGAESGLITSGAAGAMAAATAGCMAGTDPAKIWQLPDTTGIKNEVVMFGGRISFDSAIRLAGGKLVMAYTHEELEAAINDQTVMVYTTKDNEDLEKALVITKKAGVPLLLDKAAAIPPIENLSKYAKMGVDLYCFSGGKGLRGPQCSGLLLGRKDLIEAAVANTSPSEGAVCRSMKVGKEEMMGCLAAVETWLKTDLDDLDREWTKRVERIEKLVESVPGVEGEITIPTGGNRYPTLTVNWDQEAFGLTIEECDEQLRAGTPRIEVLTNKNPSLVSVVREGDPNAPRQSRPNSLRIISMTLEPGEDLIVGKRLRDIFLEARKTAGKRTWNV